MINLGDEERARSRLYHSEQQAGSEGGSRYPPWGGPWYLADFREIKIITVDVSEYKYNKRMSQHAARLMAKLSQMVVISPSPYWDLLLVLRDGTLRWTNTALGTENHLIPGNFRQNKAMLVVVFPFLRDYASILDTGLDNMTLFLPDFTISDVQTALSRHFMLSQTQPTALPGRESSGTVLSQKPGGSAQFLILWNIFLNYEFNRKNCSLWSMRQNCTENIIQQPQKTS